MNFLISIDRTLFLFFNATLSNPVFDIFFPFITERNNSIVPLLVLVPFFIYKEKKKALVVLGLAIVTVAVTDPVCVRIIKPLVHRLRPCHPSYFIDGEHVFLAGAHFLKGYKGSLSFPSAHAMNVFGQAMLFTCFYPRQRVWFFTFAGLIGFSRIYVGVHYPLDVVAGAVFGTGVGWGVVYVYRISTVRLAKKRDLQNRETAS